jgi:hypothetical protein
VLVGWNAATQPPLAAADGGWPGAEDAAARILVASGGGPVVLDSLPPIKSAEALEFPLDRLEPGIVQPSLGSGRRTRSLPPSRPRCSGRRRTASRSRLPRGSPIA